MSVGPRDVHFSSSSWSTINQQAIWVKPKNTVEAPARNILSTSNWYSKDVANSNEGVGSIREVPIIQYDQDECSSVLAVSYTHLRAHETRGNLVCRLLLE